MNAPSILLRRTTVAPTMSNSICISCRRALFAAQRRTFHSTPRAAVATFQSYPLRQPPPQPRNAIVPETSIAQPIEPVVPRVHDTRPPKQSGASMTAFPKVSEAEAQSSSKEFASSQSTSSTATTAKTAATASASHSESDHVAPTSSLPATGGHTKPADAKSEAAAVATATVGSATPKPAAKPRSKLRAPRKAAMKLTPAAVEQLRSLLEGPEPQLIRVGVRNKGCSGLAYHLEYVEKPGAFDELLEQDGVRVVIDSKALFSIIGSEMDWVEDKISQRFVFRNPNIKEECGCGESFMV